MKAIYCWVSSTHATEMVDTEMFDRFCICFKKLSQQQTGQLEKHINRILAKDHNNHV